MNCTSLRFSRKFLIIHPTKSYTLPRAGKNRKGIPLAICVEAAPGVDAKGSIGSNRDRPLAKISGNSIGFSAKAPGGAHPRFEGMDDLKIFTGRAHPELAKKVCDYLGLPVGRAIIGNFPDGEISCKIDEDIRGRDVFIIQPTCPPVNDNLMELLIMVDSCMRASADRITAVMPYFGYARQDRKDEGRVPITAKLVANMIARAGTSRVLAMDLHAAQIQGFFDIPVDHLYAAPVIDDHIKAIIAR